MYHSLLKVITISLMLVACASTTDLTTIEPLQYVALGDSYTEGTGVQPTDAWPVLLTNHLQVEGLDITLRANLAKSGWTTKQVITGQLPQLQILKPNMVSVFIGANDLFQGVTIEQYEQRYNLLIEEVLKQLPEPKRLFLVNIPDYSKTPVGRFYPKNENTKNFAERLEAFNAIIYATAAKHNLPVADVHKSSGKFTLDVSLLANDRLHPSRKGHELWEGIIYDVVVSMFE